MIKSYLAILTVFIFNSLWSMSLNSAEKSPQFSPENFVNATYQEIKEIASEQLSDAEKVSRMLSLFNDTVEHLFISRAVMGPYWKSLSESEKIDFSLAFKIYLARKYSKQFDDFSAGDLTILSVKKSGSSGFLVKSRILTENSKQFNLVWQLVGSNAGIRIINLKFEGISMVHAERPELKNLINTYSGSIPLIIEALKNY